MVELAHGSAKYIALHAHRFDPSILVDIQSDEDRRKGLIDSASFIFSNGATGPVDQMKIVFEQEGNTVALRTATLLVYSL